MAPERDESFDAWKRLMRAGVETQQDEESVNEDSLGIETNITVGGSDFLNWLPTKKSKKEKKGHRKKRKD